jgi:hypothetical protein
MLMCGWHSRTEPRLVKRDLAMLGTNFEYDAGDGWPDREDPFL